MFTTTVVLWALKLVSSLKIKLSVFWHGFLDTYVIFFNVPKLGNMCWLFCAIFEKINKAKTDYTFIRY